MYISSLPKVSRSQTYTALHVTILYISADLHKSQVQKVLFSLFSRYKLFVLMPNHLEERNVILNLMP